MYVISNLQDQKYPIKVWLSNDTEMEEECLEQAHNLSRLPFLHKWVALMPDTHTYNTLRK